MIANKVYYSELKSVKMGGAWTNKTIGVEVCVPLDEFGEEKAMAYAKDFVRKQFNNVDNKVKRTKQVMEAIAKFEKELDVIEKEMR